tara:strand:+ start:228 stop:473 length:246 start_codon:yes stop_codon:yes gene_type:complete
MSTYINLVIWGLTIWLLVGAYRLRKRRVTLGPGASAMMDKIHNTEQQAAMEIIVEEKTGYTDPEDADGNLPDLENPDRETP